MDLNATLSPSQQAYTQAAALVSSAAQVVNQFDNSVALLLIHQAKALLQMADEPPMSGCNCDGVCDTQVSEEVNIEVDALVKDIEEMMK